MLLVLLFVLVNTNTTFRQFVDFPSEIRLFQGDQKRLEFPLPMSATAEVLDPQIVNVNGSLSPHISLDGRQSLAIQSNQIGKTSLTLKLFGKLPIKRLDIRVLPRVYVVPGGQSIGVKLRSAGPLVVGHYTHSERIKQAIQVGDYLLKINHRSIHNIYDVSKAVKEAGESKKDIIITVLRDGKMKQVKLRPYYDSKEKSYRLGLYIRDSAAGVGTLTFYDPKHKVYGALGHMITDVDTGQPIRIGNGKLIHSSVTSIQKGSSGEPGEKRAIFFDENRILGNITKNTPFGVFGKMYRTPHPSLKKQMMPVAFAEEVEEGPAKIFTVIEGQKVEEFDIEILHVMKQRKPATKGMIIKVTDPRLLAKTGGIVQGMSGSPIIQKGKVVGAVTHVFVNDPRSGYGTFIEWMLQDAGVIRKPKDSLLRGVFSLNFAGKMQKYVESIL